MEILIVDLLDGIEHYYNDVVSYLKFQYFQ